MLDAARRDVRTPAATARDLDPETGPRCERGEIATERAAFGRPETVPGARRADALDAGIGARPGAVAAMQTAATVLHRGLAAGGARVGAGAAAWRQGGIAGQRPILQPGDTDTLHAMVQALSAASTDTDAHKLRRKLAAIRR